MPDTKIVQSIDSWALAERTYVLTNYFAIKLQTDINKRKGVNILKPSYDEFRFGFLGLYHLVRHRDDFDEKLSHRIDQWERRKIPSNPSKQYYLYALKLYRAFKHQLALSQLIN